MARIELEDVTKSYSRRSKYCDVEGLSFTVEDGEFFCLVGPTNAGKTTTLRLIAGLDKPARGEVRIDSERVTEMDPHERGASMLFQNLALYPNKTGYGNMAHPLEVAGVPEDERRDRVEDLADTLDITHLLDRQPGTFSGGEKQRVGIGRALIPDASAYLLDEPLGGLDAKLKTEMRVELDRLHTELGDTFVLATHDQEEAMSVADRIAVYRSGGIEQIGTPTELYDTPATEFVASFIGEPAINLVDGRVANGTLQTGDLQLSSGAALNDVEDTEYRLGLRPHDGTLRPDPQGGDLEADVDVAEPLGQETVVDVTVSGVDLRLVSTEPFAKRLEHGDDVGLTLTGDDFYLFDVADGSLVHSPHA